MTWRLVFLLACCCSPFFRTDARAQQTGPADSQLARELHAKDSLIAEIAFKTCKVSQLPRFYAADCVMLADQGLSKPLGSRTFSQFAQELAHACVAKNSGATLRRVLKPGTEQVVRLNPLAATQSAVQQHLLRQPDGTERLVNESRILRQWTKTRAGWRISLETEYLIDTQALTSASGRYTPGTYQPAGQADYETILKMDSLYFDSYNNCKLDILSAMTADDIEFYHDRGGLSNSKKDLITAIKQNICGKVTRILTPNSVEVYTIPGYGAVQFGHHSFRNTAEPGESQPSKFVVLWRLKEGTWQMTRVISLH